MMRAIPLALAVLLAANVAAAAQVVPPPTISVTGEAEVSVAPDQAQITGGVTSEAKTAREASEANNKAMAAVLQALKAEGIAEADIRTSRLALFPQSAPVRQNGPMQITGYRASNQVTVRIRDVGKVADTVDALVAAGANEIGGIDFIVSQQSKTLDDARVRALDDARRKAEIYARAANVRLGAPTSISEASHGGGPPMPMRATFKAGAATPVAPGEETLRVSVSVSYEIVK